MSQHIDKHTEYLLAEARNAARISDASMSYYLREAVKEFHQWNAEPWLQFGNEGDKKYRYKRANKCIKRIVDLLDDLGWFDGGRC